MKKFIVVFFSLFFMSTGIQGYYETDQKKYSIHLNLDVLDEYNREEIYIRVSYLADGEVTEFPVDKKTHTFTGSVYAQHLSEIMVDCFEDDVLFDDDYNSFNYPIDREMKVGEKITLKSKSCGEMVVSSTTISGYFRKAVVSGYIIREK